MSDDNDDHEVTKDDIDREIQRLRDNVSKYPALELVLRDYPDEYDPTEAPTTPSQKKAMRAITEYMRESTDAHLTVDDEPTGMFVDYAHEDGGVSLGVSNLDPHMHKGFAAFVDIVHDYDLSIVDRYPCGYSVIVPNPQVAFTLGMAGLRAQGALATQLTYVVE